MTDHKRKRRDGGRSAKIASRKKSAQIEAPRFLSRKIPCYELLSEEELVSIEEHADWILQEVGIEFWGDDEALKLFKDAGVTVKGNKLQFDKGHDSEL